jgi:hypothetical protein
MTAGVLPLFQTAQALQARKIHQNRLQDQEVIDEAL